MDEPVELRDRMRELAAASPEQVRSRLVEEMIVISKRAQQLSPLAMTERDLEAVCESYRREFWLWLVGERTWAQCADGLAGRFARRGKLGQI